MTIERSPASKISTPSTPRQTLRFYAGLPRGLARDMLAIVNKGWTPEAWKAEQRRIDRREHALKQARMAQTQEAASET